MRIRKLDRILLSYLILNIVFLGGCTTYINLLKDIAKTNEELYLNYPSPEHLFYDQEENGILLIDARYGHGYGSFPIEGAAIINNEYPDSVIFSGSFNNDGLFGGSSKIVLFPNLVPGMYTIVKIRVTTNNSKKIFFPNLTLTMNGLVVEVIAGTPVYFGRLFLQPRFRGNVESDIEYKKEEEIESWEKVIKKYKGSPWIKIINDHLISIEDSYIPMPIDPDYKVSYQIAKVPPKKSKVIEYYIGGSFGQAMPTGNITSITNLITFESPVAATGIYDRGLAIGIHLGAREGHRIAEMTIDTRLSPVTIEGQKILNSTSTLGNKVNIEYFTFELFGGRNETIWSSETSRIDAFLGLGIGAGHLGLYKGPGVYPVYNEGLTASIKLGLDFTKYNIMFRLAGKYQALNYKVDIPHDFIIYLGAYLHLNFLSMIVNI